MKRIDCGDTARLPTGEEGPVIGTMSLQPPVPNAATKRSVCILLPGQPVWIGVELVELVAKAKK